jgi:hypothetical protein
MQAEQPADAMRRAAEGQAAYARSVAGAPAETASQRGSFAGGLGGGIAGAYAGGALGAAGGPPGIAVGAALGQIAGSAAGSGLGKLGGYYATSVPSPEDFTYKYNRSLEAAKNDALMNVALSGAGIAGRVALAPVKGMFRMGGAKLFGLNTPEAQQAVEEARQVGIRLVPLDVSPMAKTYAKLVSVIPFLSGKIRAQQGIRAGEVENVLRPFIGPLESGLNEVALGKNFLAATQNAAQVRKDWYTKIYQQAEDYFASHPDIQISNDAVDAARQYGYEQSKRELPTLKTAGRMIGEPQTSEKVAAGAVRNLSSPAEIDSFIREVGTSPTALTYDQFRGLTENINSALDKATPTQQRTLVQMRESLDTAVENVDDAGARSLIQRSRATYRQVMDFFEHPQAKVAVDVNPEVVGNVGALKKPIDFIPKKMSSQVFETLFNDATPESVRNIAKLAGPDNMKYMVDRVVAQKFNKVMLPASTPGGPEKMDWNALRGEFGLNEPGSYQYDATKQMLKSGQYPVSMDQVSKTIDVLEKTMGDTIPPLVSVWLRSVSLGGPKSVLRNFTMLGTAEEFSKTLSPVGAVGLLLGMRRMSSFVVDPNRLHTLETATSAMKPFGVKQAAVRQLLRYAAGDMAYETRGGRPTKQEIDEQYNRLATTVGQYTAQTGEDQVNPADQLKGAIINPLQRLLNPVERQ